MRGERLVRWLAVGALLFFIAAVINIAVGGPARKSLMAAAVALPFLVARLGALMLSDRVDVKLEAALQRQLKGFKVVTQDFPDYRYVDVFGAVEDYCAGPDGSIIDSTHGEELGLILDGTFYAGSSGAVQAPPLTSFQLDAQKEAMLPLERFWTKRASGEHERHLIARVRLLENQSIARLELATGDLEHAEHVLAELRERSCAASIYRGQALEVSFALGVKDEYGNVDQSGRMKVAFHKAPTLDREDIVLDDRVWPILEHSLVSLYTNREQLAKHGVALKRGFLFYGPPGTGKSFTARYLATVLSGATAIYCGGTALHHVASAFNLARLLMPAIIVMEDVDLVFSSRDINPFGGALGDLFDQIDALDDHEPISIILTTNAIDRVEAAVKDRPGRVSQCILFGPPSRELRGRYLKSYLARHRMADADVEHVVDETDGATQAFLKELTQRGLQFAVEAGRATAGVVTPTAADFDAALREMQAFDSKASRSITGFRS